MSKNDNNNVNNGDEYPELITVKNMFEEKVGNLCRDKNISFVSSFSLLKPSDDGSGQEGQSFNVGSVNIAQDPTMFAGIAAIIVNDRKLFKQARSLAMMRRMLNHLERDEEYDYTNDAAFEHQLTGNVQSIAIYCQKNGITMAMSILMSRTGTHNHSIMNAFGIGGSTPAHYLLGAYVGHLIHKNREKDAMEAVQDWFDDEDGWEAKYDATLRKFGEEAESGIFDNRNQKSDDSAPIVVDQQHLLDEGVSQRFDNVMEPLESNFMKNLMDYLNKNKPQ